MIRKSIVRKYIALGILLILVTTAAPCLTSAEMFTSQQHIEKNNVIATTPSLIYREPGPTIQSILYADGSILDLQTETITRPILLNGKTDMTPEAFKNLMKSAETIYHTTPDSIITGKSRGLDLQFAVYYPPSGAEEGINDIVTYMGNLFSDPITVVIYLGFGSMGPGILGGVTSAYASSVTWANTRNGLIAGMDDDDTIQTHLPSGNTIPVRYNGNSGSVTNEDQCFFTIANYCATIGTATEDAAYMTINTDYSWDYDPSNGISSGAYCFQSVLAHEVGHALGFTSGADFREGDIEALDIYRFQQSDGSGDYNPDTLAEFQTTARMVDINAPGTDDDVVTDVIDEEYQMSDGDPYQCSHFSQWVYAIMEPGISSGSTYYPDFYQTPDKTMMDAIGWDYTKPPDSTPPKTTCSLSGTMGQDGWYISNVTVTLTATDVDGSGVDHIYYKIDGGSWNEYTAKFVVTLEGEHTMVFYSVDKAGNEETEKTMSFKIDRTAPILTLTKEQIDPFTAKFTAEASDAVSGIDRVDFIVEGILESSDTNPPYEYTWTGLLNAILTATAYDNAGNARSQSMSTPVAFFIGKTSLQIHLLQHLMEQFIQHQLLS